MQEDKPRALGRDLFQLFLEASYPQYAFNLAVAFPRLVGEMMRHPRLYFKWFKKFFPDFDIPDVLMSAGVGGPKAEALRQLFIKMWGETYFIEAYKLDAVYNLERFKSMQPVVCGPKDEVVLVTYSRFPSNTALKSVSRVVTDAALLTPERATAFQANSAANQTILDAIGASIQTRRSVDLWNEEIPFVAKRNVWKARRALADKIQCFTMTSYASITFAHNVQLLCNLYESDGTLVAEAGDSVKRLRFDRNDWTRVGSDARR